MKNNLGNKKESYNLVKKGYISVNNVIVDNPLLMIDECDVVMCQNKKLNSSPLVYYMLNKPKGYISANRDDNPCVLDLFDRKDLSIAGRLDRDTTGLMLLTNDKSLIKKITLPDNHLPKKYLVKVQNKLEDFLVEKCRKGIIIDNDVLCLPAILEIIDDYHCYLTINEGKYHQIKKMFLSMNNKVLELKRVKIGDIELDLELKEGEYRKLTKEELFFIKNDVK